MLATIDNVKEYYGKILSSSKDLKTSACCAAEGPSLEHRAILANIEPEILDRFYGCGCPVPPALEGATVLDLGCGTGRDVYLLSALVGETGRVIGIDMTDEQLNVAKKYQDVQAERFGHSRSNVEFVKGYIEDLASAGIADDSVDLVVSNCVINLSPDKNAVMKEIFRVLKPGGELYFSDVFAGRRVPQALREHPVLYGECLSGALYIEDFRRILRGLGCLDYRVVTQSRIELTDPEIVELAGAIDFHSLTIRAFKLDSLEDLCEDFGQVATYKGSIAGQPHRFELDDHHLFESGKPMLVCGNTAAMLQETRYQDHFVVLGDRSVHYGPFDCSPVIASSSTKDGSASGACC